MDPVLRMWVESVFSVAYLFTVWGLVIAMWRRHSQGAVVHRELTALFILAFGLLALGDTGHTGFRVVAYALGNLGHTISLFGASWRLVGLGSFSTAVTITLFYIIMLIIWHRRFEQPYGALALISFAAGAARLIVLFLPQNQWGGGESVAPAAYTWYLLRNALLTIQGLMVAYLILRAALAAQDGAFKWMGIMILISYGCYLPTLLFQREVPMISMLMIPKTLAYLAIGFIAFNALFRPPQRAAQPAVVGRY